MAQWRRTTDTTVTDEITLLTAETQQYGDTLIRLSEYSMSRPLSQYQKEVLLKQQKRLKLLGIELIPMIEGTLHLRASHIVGAGRFVQGRSQVTVQVEPRLGQVDFLRMLDYALNRIRTDQQQVDIGVETGGATGLLLEYFADMVLSFLQRQHYRSYTYITNEGSNKVKGKLLMTPYITRSLPRAEPHIVPCKYLDYTSDVLENQIIAYSVYIATQLTSLLPGRVQRRIKEKLALCTRLLKGVSVRQVTVSEIKRTRYNRLNIRFQPLHELCLAILQNQSISLGPAERIPFLSFATDMTDLFEGYIGSLFRYTSESKAALPSRCTWISYRT
jgi:5-methylcytosine-specific restriction endonuclease McrBC regulatory subunit McrC